MSAPFGLATVLVAIDDSSAAAQALDFAIELGKRYQSALLICTAVNQAAIIAAISSPAGGYPDVSNLLDEYDRAANELLAAAVSRATAAGARATSVLVEGSAVRAIADCAKARAVDAIVMGTHGRGGLERMFLGSTAQGVLRLAEVPTFVVREHAGAAPEAASFHFEHILIAVDDSEPADAAADVAIGLAAAGGADVLCCTVTETNALMERAEEYGFDPDALLDEMRGLATRLTDAKVALATSHGVKAESIVVEGVPADALLAVAAERHVGLIAVGTHGRGGLSRLFLGSVAESVVRRSPVPVLVVRGRPARPAQ